jgi:hypothetical protein
MPLMADMRPRSVDAPEAVNTTYEGWQLAIAIQQRDDARALLGLIRCHQTQGIPRTLRAIHRELVKIRKQLEAQQ